MIFLRNLTAFFLSISSAAAVTTEELQSYLDQNFGSKITRVSIGKNTVRIEGRVAPEARPAGLADIPMDVPLNDSNSWKNVVDLETEADGTFRIDLPRLRKRDERDYDRLTSRWQIVRKTEQEWQPQSHARYAEWVDCRAPELPAATLKNKKGIGGWHDHHLPDELRDLNISAVTINVMVHSLISPNNGPNTTAFQWQGRTYFANDPALADLDRKLLRAAKDKVMVSAILLVANPAKTPGAPVIQTIGHPDARAEGMFAMPNVMSEEGISMYGAILNLMAERWSRADGKFGRIHHWIVHNEVNAGAVWTNAGDIDIMRYMDLYQRSMRLTDLIARQYDPNSRAFMSLTHHWGKAANPKWYSGRGLIDLLARFTQAEGDFPWALAFHPYPQDLNNPRTWEDPHTPLSFDAPYVTPRNIEVLDAYMKRTPLLYKGNVRPVHLSENGFNSRDYSPKSLEDQAAGMAWAWKKIQPLSSIQSWQYHNWVDNRHEGGLKIGLRKFPDDENEPLGKKPIWHLYQALGTPQENSVAEPYLKTIGIQSWDEIIHRQPIQ